MVQTKKFNKTMIDAIVCIAVFAFFLVIPPVGAMTSYGMKILGAFIALLWAWGRNMPALTAVLLVFAVNAINGANFQAQTASAFFGNVSLWLCIFMFVMLIPIQRTGIVEYLTRKILSLKLSQKGPYWLMAVMMFACYVASALSGSATVVILLIVSILKKLRVDLNLEQYNLWTGSAAICCCLACFIGSIAVPYNPTYPTIFALLPQYGVEAPSMISCMIMTWIIGAICIVVMPLFTKFVIRPKIDASAFENIDFTVDVKLTRTMKWGLLAIAIMVFVILAPTFMPATWGFTKMLSGFGILGSFMICLVVFCFVKDDNGVPLFDFSDGMKNGVNWSITWYMGACFFLNTYLTGADSGFVATVNEFMAPLAGVNSMVLAVFCTILLIVVTNVISNIVAALVILPIAIPLTSADPIATAVVIYGICLGMLVAVALPSSSLGGIILHGEKDFIKSNQVMLYGFLQSFVVAVIVAVCFFAFGGAVFG